MIGHNTSQAEITMVHVTKPEGDEDQIIVEAVEEEGEDPNSQRSYSIESRDANQDENELSRSKRRASIMPLMASDDTVIVGLKPSNKRGSGTPTNKLTFITEERKKAVSQSLMPIRRSYKLMKQDADEEDPYEV